MIRFILLSCIIKLDHFKKEGPIMTIGIDAINFFTPNAYVDLVELAKVRGQEPDKFTIGIGQSQMAVQPVTQDVYSMAINATMPMLSDEDKQNIDLIIFGTESGLDASKSGAVIVQEALDIQPFCRAFEAKQACYGGTVGLLTARDYIAQHPNKKALILASDIARYGLNTSGEVTQGAGAIAMLISEQPRILEIEADSVPYAQNVYDFWRPNYSDTAFVDGKFSNETYIEFFNKTFHRYNETHHTTLDDFDAICFHMPYTKMGFKALRTVLDEVDEKKQKALVDHYDYSTRYPRYVGNLYTGSLYLSLMSMLSLDPDIHEGNQIGMFSYGSGAAAEFFVGRPVKGFRDALPIQEMATLFKNRKKLSVDEYEAIFNQTWLTEDGRESYHCEFDNAPVQLDYIDQHRRYYRGLA